MKNHLWHFYQGTSLSELRENFDKLCFFLTASMRQIEQATGQAPVLDMENRIGESFREYASRPDNKYFLCAVDQENDGDQLVFVAQTYEGVNNESPLTWAVVTDRQTSPDTLKFWYETFSTKFSDKPKMEPIEEKENAES